MSKVNLLLYLGRSIFGESCFSEDDVMAFAGAVGHEHSHGANGDDPVSSDHAACSSSLASRETPIIELILVNLVILSSTKLKSDFNFRGCQNN